jgi:hypothetical protein
MLCHADISMTAKVAKVHLMLYSCLKLEEAKGTWIFRRRVATQGVVTASFLGIDAPRFAPCTLLLS